MQIRMLREIDDMFSGVPQTRKTLEAKEEMLQNLMEKYNDLIAEGRSEEAAFNIALASVGDISDLLEELQQPIPKVASFVEEEDLPIYDDAPEIAPETIYRHQSAALVAIAVMLYILSPVAVILFGGRVGVVLLFAMIALATGLLIYNGMTKPHASTPEEEAGPEPPSARPSRVTTERIPYYEQTLSRPREEPPRRTPQQKRFLSSINSAIWTVALALYFLLSFMTGAWHVTWVLFLIAIAISNVVRAFVDLYR